MSQVNINRKNDDPFYRYKMPRIIAKVEGRGNGIKTVVSNMVEISRSLSRPPSYPTKYLGCELGAQTLIDTKNDRFIVNGSHQSDKLQDVLDGFIEKYVLCPSCENPETELLAYPKKEKIALKCKACGGLNPLNIVHRMNQYIFKCPPSQKSSKTAPQTSHGAIRKSNGNDEQVTTNKDGFDISVKLPLTSSTSTDWSIDTSHEAQKLRIQQLEGRAKGLTINEDMEKSLKDRIDMFYAYLEKLKASITEKDYNGIVGESERLDICEYAVAVLFECFFSDGVILRGIKTHEKLIGMLTKDSVKSQRNLIGSIESLIERHVETLLPKVSHIFKLLYDLDLVMEDVFIKWAAKPSTRFISDKVLAEKVHENARPFISWLQTAEEESSEEEEDVSVDFQHKISVVKQEPTKTTQPKDAKDDQVEEDEIDIDEI